MNWIGFLLAGAGLFSICGAAMDWDFFMESRRAYLLVKILGRNGARTFYALLGLAIFVLGMLIAFGIVQDRA